MRDVNYSNNDPVSRGAERPKWAAAEERSDEGIGKPRLPTVGAIWMLHDLTLFVSRHLTRLDQYSGCLR